MGNYLTKRELKVIIMMSIAFIMLFFPSLAGASTETPINVNQQYSGNISSSGEVDYYRFQLSEAGKVQINFRHDLIDESGTYWKAYVLDSSNNEHYCMSIGGRDINLDSWNIYLPQGTFYLKITNYYHSSMDYIFTLNYTSSNGNYEEEFNNSMTSANLIDVNHQYTGNLFESGDDDYFKFQLSEAGKVQINFRHDLIDESGTYWKAYVLDSSNNEHYYMSIGGRDINVDSWNIYLPQGTFYLKITNYYYSGTDYIFTLNYTPSNGNYEEEFNNSMTTANQVLFNHEYTGSMFESSDDDYFKFQLPEAGKIQINFGHALVDESGTYWKAHVLDSYNEEQYTASISGRQTNFTSDEIYLPAGEYYFKVDNYYYSGTDYWFTVINNDVEPVPTEEAVQSLPKEHVALNHEWTIKFNAAVNLNTINDQNIFVFNASGARINTNVTLGSDSKTVMVSLNNTQYQPSQEYTLHISSAVKSASNISLPRAVQMKFTTTN
ncbi:MAG: Ig-like domain-containing protein [Syntrophomonas sp.]